MQQSAQTVLNQIAGKKTYGVVTLAGVLLFGSWQHWWVLPEEVYKGLQFLALAFIKAGLTRDGEKKSNEPLNQTGAPVQPGAPTSTTS